MLRPRVILGLLGSLIGIEGALLLLPSITAIIYRESPLPFILPSLLCLLLALLIRTFVKEEGEEIYLRESFLLVSAGWTLFSILGALPYLFYNFSFIDALFESTSGFTTTGATIIEDIEAQPRSLLFWRSLTQWVGGMGIIVLFIAIFPRLSVGGRQLFSAEVPGPSYEKFKPRIRETAKSLWIVYVILSAAEFVLLLLFGMNPYEALLHTFSTMSTGGFSPLSSSIGAYSPVLQLIIIIFMIIAGANFVLHYRALMNSRFEYHRDEEFRAYFVLIILSTLLVSIILSSSGVSLLRALLLSSFQVVSIMTTTGFTTANFDSWPNGARMILFLLMFIGGSAGSTAGALKVVRFTAILKYALNEIRRGIHPKGVFSIRIGGNVVSETVMSSVLSVFILYLLLFAISSTILSILGYDLVTSLSAVAACLGNVGPGLGLVGPSESYAFLHPLAKLLLSFCMIAGRLEVLPILILFSPKFWKD
ncbi:MAG: TrkH family potassium uptake protein [Archaeoglobi archaeon]|nr:TrkH family potassium uptake protein [Candidatus Mnemosynella bozhongmuii]